MQQIFPLPHGVHDQLIYPFSLSFVRFLSRCETLERVAMGLGSFPENQRIPATVLMDMWVELYGPDEEGMYTLANVLELSARNLVNLVPDSEANGYCEGHVVMQHDEMFPSNWSDIQVPAVEVLILNFRLNFRSRSYTLPHFMLMMNQLKVLILTSYVSSAAK
ncbi:hypothetical protein RJ639_014341, partial [Escallonia herrerae]